MNPSTLYLYTLSAFAILSKTFALYEYSDVEVSSSSESELDEDTYAKILNRVPGESYHTDDEMDAFTKSLDKSVAKVNRIYRKELGKLQAEMQAQGKKYSPIHGERLYRKISHAVFRDYGNFSTLKDGTFFGNMFDEEKEEV